MALAGGLIMIPSLLLPIWRIDLFAPQYPEGLYMLIWKDDLSGDVQVINGLNHYIGMKHISEDMFPELNYITYVLYGMIGIGIITFSIRRVWMLWTHAVLLISAAGLALYDFYKWGYDYGHNLDPNAAIQVPGMSYQPPLLGHKKLLNFDAWSTPGQGGWFILAGAVLVIGALLLEYFYFKKRSNTLA